MTCREIKRTQGEPGIGTIDVNPGSTVDANDSVVWIATGKRPLGTGRETRYLIRRIAVVSGLLVGVAAYNRRREQSGWGVGEPVWKECAQRATTNAGSASTEILRDDNRLGRCARWKRRRANKLHCVLHFLCRICVVNCIAADRQTVLREYRNSAT
jgi:hypothetical protein